MTSLTTTLVDQTSRATAGTSVSSVPIGTANSTRVVVAFIYSSGGSISSDTWTIGGVTATVVNALAGNPIFIYAAVPTGTTATIAAGVSTGWEVDGVWSVTGSSGAYAFANQFNSGSGAVSTGSFNVAGGDSLIGVVLALTGTASFTGGVVGGTSYTSALAGYTLLDGNKDYASATSITIDASTSGTAYVFGLQMSVPHDPTTAQSQTSNGSYTFIEYGTVFLQAWGTGASGGRRGRGSGGGAYAQTNKILVHPGDVLYWTIPAAPAGTATTAGAAATDDTWSRLNTNSPPTTTADGVLAAKGAAGNSTVNGAGGATASCVGDIKFAGGSGGNTGTGTTLRGGGGGAAGNTGSGGNASGATAGIAGTGDGTAGAGGAGTTTAAGGDGNIYGGGGGSTSNASFNGGAGGAGLVIWTFTPAVTLTQKLLNIGQAITTSRFW